MTGGSTKCIEFKKFIMFRTVITGSGAYIPPIVRSNSDFLQHTFYSESGEQFHKNDDLISKFKKITGISERRYAPDDLLASDMGYEAAIQAISDSQCDPETIDQLIVAQNFGNVVKNNIQSASVPSLASLIKQRLGIRNPSCIAYDVLFGCPGWLQGVIQADAFFRASMAKRALVIGTESLSRVIDIHDRDSMIFSDGAGATVLEYRSDPEGTGPGILGYAVQSHTFKEAAYIDMRASYGPESDETVRYLKMNGRKVYEYALEHVPLAMKKCLDDSGVHVEAVSKILIHQANEKMDEAIVHRLYQLYNIPVMPELIMPMSISWLGNSSVATIPTLFDLIRKGNLTQHKLSKGDIVLFASVGAGMNINAVCYRY